MIEKRIQHAVSRVLGETKADPQRFYHLCWWHDRLQCLHVHHTTVPHPIFLAIGGQILTGGLSPYQWRLLTTRILHFCRMADLTVNRLSPQSTTDCVSQPVPAPPQVTDFDCKRLQILLAAARASQPETTALLEILQRLLETADVLPAEDIPPDVVTMNSQMRLWNNDTAREMILSLVFPADARGSNMDRVKLSVLTHMGMSLLGRRVGDLVENSIRIDKLLYQPEAAGHFDQ